MKVYSLSQKKIIDVPDGQSMSYVSPTPAPSPTPTMGSVSNMGQTQKKQPSLLDRIATSIVKTAADSHLGNVVQQGAGMAGMFKNYLDYKLAKTNEQKIKEAKEYTGYRNKVSNLQKTFGFNNDQKTDQFNPVKYAEGISKGAAEGASFVVPGGKLAEGAGVAAKVAQGAKIGATSGALMGYGQSKADNAFDTAVDVVKGGIAGGTIGAGMGAVGGVASKMKGAKSGTQAKIINPEVPASPTMVTKKKEIVDELARMGINGKNAEEVATKVGTKYKELGSQAEEILANSTKSKSLGRLDKVLRKQLNENGEYFIPDDPRYEKLLNRELTLLAKKSENGKLTAKALYEFKNELAAKLNNGFRKEAGDLSSPISDIEGVRLDLWRQIDDQITGIEPEVKTITKDMSVLHKASPGLKKSMEQVKEARPLGIPTGINLNKQLQNTQSVAAGSASLAGRTGEFVGNPKTIKAAVIGRSILPEDQQQTNTPLYEPGGSLTTPIQQQVQGEPSVVETDPNGEWQTMSDGKTYSMDGNWVFDEQADDWIPNQQMIGTASGADQTNPQAPMSLSQYNQALNTLAGQNSTSAVRQYGLLQKERDYYYPETKLSSTAQKRVAILNQSEGIYKMVEDLALGSGTGLGAWFKAKAGGLPGVEGGSEEDLNRVNLALAKGLAGALASEVGVATDRDIERWLGLMPRVEDTMAERKRALSRLATEIMRSRQQIEAQVENPTSTSAGSDMSSYFFGNEQ